MSKEQKFDFEEVVRRLRAAADALQDKRVQEGAEAIMKAGEALSAVQDALQAVAVGDAVKAVAVQDALKAVAVQDALKAVAVQDALKAVAVQDALKAVAVQDALKAVAVGDAVKAVAVSDAVKAVAARVAAHRPLSSEQIRKVQEAVAIALSASESTDDDEKS